MSIIPGMETRAPERTETSSGFSGIAEIQPDRALHPVQRVLDLFVEIIRDRSRLFS